MTGMKLSGQVGLLNRDQDKIYGYGSHSRTFDSKFHTLGKSNDVGLGYNHFSGNGRTSIGAQAGASFNPGMKPIPSFSIGLTHKFRK